MVTGGLGHMGINLAEGLFHELEARLVLVGRTSLPEPEEWAAASEDPSRSDESRKLLKRLADLRALRDDVLVLKADLNDATAGPGTRSTQRSRVSAKSILSCTAPRASTPARSRRPPRRGRGGRSAVLAEAARPAITSWRRCADASRALGAAFVDLDRARRSRPRRVLRGERRARRHRARGRRRGGSASTGTCGTTRPKRRSAGMPSPIHPAEGSDAFLRLLGADVGHRVLVVVGDLAPATRGVGSPRRTAAANGADGRAPSATEPCDAVRRAAHRDGARARRDLGRAARHRSKSASTIASSTSAATRCWRCRSPPRSATGSRSSCRCSSCSRRRRVAELAVLVDQARAGTPDRTTAGLRCPTGAGGRSDAARWRGAGGRGEGRAIATSTTTSRADSSSPAWAKRRSSSTTATSASATATRRGSRCRTASSTRARSGSRSS